MIDRGDIIEMARECGFEQFDKDANEWICFFDELERFAAIIASRVAAAAKAEEREACAKVCEDLGYAPLEEKRCANAIRARSNHD